MLRALLGIRRRTIASLRDTAQGHYRNNTLQSEATTAAAAASILYVSSGSTKQVAGARSAVGVYILASTMPRLMPVAVRWTLHAAEKRENTGLTANWSGRRAKRLADRSADVLLRRGSRHLVVGQPRSSVSVCDDCSTPRRAKLVPAVAVGGRRLAAVQRSALISPSVRSADRHTVAGVRRMTNGAASAAAAAVAAEQQQSMPRCG